MAHQNAPFAGIGPHGMYMLGYVTQHHPMRGKAVGVYILLMLACPVKAGVLQKSLYSVPHCGNIGGRFG
jgi:hypothetical protein